MTLEKQRESKGLKPNMHPKGLHVAIKNKEPAPFAGQKTKPTVLTHGM